MAALSGGSGQGRTDEEDSGGIQGRLANIAGHCTYGRAQELFVGPTNAASDDDRGVGAVRGAPAQQTLGELLDEGDRQKQHERGAGGGIGLDGLALGHGCPGSGCEAGEHDGLGDAGNGELALGERGGRVHRGHPWYHLEATVVLTTPEDLFPDRAVDRRVARMQAHDGCFWVRGEHLAHVPQGHGLGVVELRAVTAMFEERLRYERSGPDDNISGGEALRAAQGDEVRRARSGPNEGDHLDTATGTCLLGGNTTVAR